MILNFYFKYFDKENFPIEIGEKIFSLQDDKIVNTFYWVNNNPFIDTDYQKAKLPDVRKINFLIGSNNSGKSRFLRSLFKINGEVSDDDMSVSQLHLEILGSQIISRASSTTDFENEVRKIWDSVVSLLDSFQKSEDIINRIKTCKDIHLDKLRYFEKDSDDTNSYEECFTLLNLMLLLIEKVKFNNDNKEKDKLYIPIMRSLISDTNLQKSAYISIIKNKFKLEHNIFTGLDLYDKIDELHNSIEIGLLENFSRWIREKFYNDYDVQIIPDRKSSS